MVKDLNDPTNVDTVPAMLTPGEFVLNKEATAMFGPQIEAMNQAGLQQRQAENEIVKANIGKKISKLHGEGYTAPGQAYAIAKSMGYNKGGLVGFLKEHEGYRDKAYQDQAGVWTIGYGRTTNPDGSPIKPGQTTNQEKEDKWLDARAASDRAATEAFAKEHGYDWNDQQIDALASFRYNIGNLDQLTQGGTRTTEQISEMLPAYNKAGGKVSQGLINRRQSELDLFSGGSKQSQEVPTMEAPPHRPEAVVQEAQVPVPGGDAPSGDFLGNDLAGLATSYFQPQAPVQVQGAPLQQVNPEYIPSVARRGDRRRNRNEGGPVQYLNVGGQSRRGRRRKEKGGPATAEQLGPNYTSAYSGGGRNAPRGPLQPKGPEQDRTINPLPPGRDPNINRFNQELGRLSGQAALALGPQESGAVPAVDNLPPVPASDEALLQNSSQVVEAQEERTSNQGQRRTEAGGPAVPAQLAIPEYEGELGGGDVSIPTAPTSNQGQRRTEAGGPATAEQLGEDYTTSYVGGGRNNPRTQVGEAPTLAAPSAYEGGGRNVARDAPGGPQIPGGPAGLAGPELDTGLSLDTEAPKMTPTERDLKGQELATEKVSEIASQEQPNETLANTDVDTVAAGGEEILRQNPKAANRIKSQLKEGFGDLIDGKELARMAVMFLGARATGASPGQALAFAGQNYIQRIDAKHGAYNKAAASGSYTRESLKTYKETGDPADLMPKGVAPVELGQTKEFYGPDGKRINARQVQVGENKVWVDKNNQPLNLNSVHEDPSRAPGTPEYRARVQDEAKGYGDVFKGLQDRFGKFKGDSGDVYTTDLTPDGAGYEAAKFALKNEVPVDVMGNLIDSAYSAARRDSTDGKRVKKLEAYLNEQYVRSQVGDSSLFEGASGEKTNMLFKTIARQARDLPENQGLSQAAISTKVIGIYRKKWSALSEQERKSYDRRSGKGYTGFMTYLQDQL